MGYRASGLSDYRANVQSDYDNSLSSSGTITLTGYRTIVLLEKLTGISRSGLDSLIVHSDSPIAR